MSTITNQAEYAPELFLDLSPEKIKTVLEKTKKIILLSDVREYYEGENRIKNIYTGIVVKNWNAGILKFDIYQTVYFHAYQVKKTNLNQLDPVYWVPFTHVCESYEQLQEYIDLEAYDEFFEQAAAKSNKKGTEDNPDKSKVEVKVENNGQKEFYSEKYFELKRIHESEKEYDFNVIFALNRIKWFRSKRWSTKKAIEVVAKESGIEYETLYSGHQRRKSHKRWAKRDYLEFVNGN